jgi:Holliday junction resolvase
MPSEVIVRRAAKVDANQTEIVNALRQVGASVQSLASTGKGCPDLLVGFRGVNWLLEIKDGQKVRSARKLTEDQVVWHQTWRGKVYIVESVDQALNLLNG